MGSTVWVLKEGQDEDEWDHSFLISQEKHLDKLANSLDIKKPSDFFDHSILAKTSGKNLEPNYLDTKEAIESFSALVDAIKAGHAEFKSKYKRELLEELEDCLAKITAADKKNHRVRLAIIP